MIAVSSENSFFDGTTTGAQTWWQYNANGEATWMGKAPGGKKIELAWDGLGLLRAVSDSGNAQSTMN